MDGRPLLRFLYVENAKGDRPILTDDQGNVFEDNLPVRPFGMLGQLPFVQEDDTNVYKTDYIVVPARIVDEIQNLQEVLTSADKRDPVICLEDKSIYVCLEGSTQWQKQPSIKDVLGLGRFVYDQQSKKLYYGMPPDGNLVEISSGGSGNNTIQCLTSEAVFVGQLCCMSDDGSVKPATKEGGKAVGYALSDAPMGSKVAIQVGGVFTKYSRYILTPGTVYYQWDDGDIRWVDDPITVKHPAALALSSDSFVILTEVHMGGGTGGGGSGAGDVHISGINVLRKEIERSGSSSTLDAEVINLTEVMVDALGAEWNTQPYILKQVLSIQNTDPVAASQFEISSVKNNSKIVDTIPPKQVLVIPVQSQDWVLKCRGKYKVSVLVEIVSSLLAPKITDQSGLQPGMNPYEFIDPKDGKTKYVILGTIKKFSLDSEEEVLFDLPKWIKETILSEDYLVLCQLSLTNKTGAIQKIRAMVGDDLLYEFDIVPNNTFILDLHREDVRFIAVEPGSVRATANIQATAYIFKT